MSFEFDNTLSLRYSIRGNRNGSLASDQQPIQFVELRLGHSSHLISRSSHQILQQSPSTPIADALFPLPLRELEDPPFLSHFYVVRFLSSFNLPIAVCDAIFEKIASFALHLAAGNVDINFHIMVAVDFIQMLWVDLDPLFLQEDSPPARNGAPASAIERLKKQKFDGFGLEELGDCSVCYDELNGEKEVTRIPCGHVYHHSCIVNWLEMSNSCPLCRSKLEE